MVTWYPDIFSFLGLGHVIVLESFRQSPSLWPWGKKWDLEETLKTNNVAITFYWDENLGMCTTVVSFLLLLYGVRLLSQWYCLYLSWSLTMFKNRGSEDALKMLIKGCWKEYNSSSCSLILCILKTNTEKQKHNIPHCILYFLKLKRLFCLGWKLAGGKFGKHTHEFC